MDQYRVRGAIVAINTFATSADSGRVLDAVAKGQTTVSYLETPYFVQVANLLIVIVSDDPDVARTLIAAIS